MRNNIIHLGYLPRWVIFSIDLCLVLFADLVTYLIVSNLTFKYYDTASVFQRTMIIVLTQIFFFFVFKTYAGIIRHSTLNDGFNLFKATFSTFIALVVLNYSHFYWHDSKIFLMPALLLTFFISFIFLLSFRIAVKIIYQVYIEASQASGYQKVVIYGTDNHAISLANALNAEQPRRYKLVGFIDKLSLNNTSKSILNTPIFSNNKPISDILEKAQANAILITEKNLTKEEKITIVEECLENNIKVFTLPSIINWQDSQQISNQISSFEIKDLLERYFFCNFAPQNI